MPEKKPLDKKHPCPDCFMCQWCGDSRCSSCKGWVTKKSKPCASCPSKTKKA